MSVMPVPTTPCPMCGGRECGWTPERVAREAAAVRETHPTFDEVWQVSSYQELTRQSRARIETAVSDLAAMLDDELRRVQDGLATPASIERARSTYARLAGASDR